MDGPGLFGGTLTPAEFIQEPVVQGVLLVLAVTTAIDIIVKLIRRSYE